MWDLSFSGHSRAGHRPPLPWAEDAEYWRPDIHAWDFHGYIVCCGSALQSVHQPGMFLRSYTVRQCISRTQNEKWGRQRLSTEGCWAGKWRVPGPSPGRHKLWTEKMEGVLVAGDVPVSGPCWGTLEQGSKSPKMLQPGPTTSWRSIQGCKLPCPYAAEIGSSDLPETLIELKQIRKWKTNEDFRSWNCCHA